MITDQNLYLQDEDIYSENLLIFDMQQLINTNNTASNEEDENAEDDTKKKKLKCPYNLILDNDLELTREHYHKPIKHGVVTLDDQVFSMYTNSLLHAKNAMHKYKTRAQD